jgi:hypothetical protein
MNRTKHSHNHNNKRTITTAQSGAVGPKGDTGAAGAPGAQGPKGDTGANGAVGPAGPKGDTGANGAQGMFYFVLLLVCRLLWEFPSC